MSGTKYVYDHPRPALTVDVALVRRGGSGWEVLLIRRAREPFAGRWALPGGFVDENEPLDRAAARELKEECDVDGVELEQLRAFGDPGRDPRGHTVSIAWIGFAPDAVRPRAGDDASGLAWFSIDRLPELAFDHDEILRVAAARVRS
ncbi:MAG TPA: NUDIX hydrolase [Thermoanaerobaculia bacterium]|nr:NUDIX hydrolase [Thermoanaerobaculia bacterium]